MSIPVIVITIVAGICHCKDQLIGKGGVPRNHLLVQEYVIIGIEMSFLAFYFGGRVVVGFLAGDVIRICVTIVVSEFAIDRNENGSGVPGKGNW